MRLVVEVTEVMTFDAEANAKSVKRATVLAKESILFESEGIEGRTDCWGWERSWGL